MNQELLPAIRSMKEFDAILSSSYEYFVLLHAHIAQIKSIVDTTHKHRKKILIHADMIDGLKNDEQGAQFLCQYVKPDGIISTKKQVILTAKKRNILAIQRVFVLDKNALDHSLSLIKTTNPDYIEVLPGILPENIFQEIKQHTNIQIIAGGLIRTKKDITQALANGAVAVSTSANELWRK